ncbi:MAG: efflux RND transporter periplasmic adaptor subunit [Rubrivivax sp.]|nr:efflux RND transporter periplasmic adaptor subunit [Rubrivivax sp.]
MRAFVSVLLMSLLLAACGKPDKAAAEKAAAAAKAAQPLLLAPEDLYTVASGALASGPVITGSVLPERRADLRAEVAAVVVQVLRDNGESVRAGDLLVRLDDTAIRDSLASAEESVRALTQAFEQAERQVQRLRTLQAQGMTSTQALEDAEVRRNNAQSDLVAARARVVSARQQQQRTLVRAPFDGVVSERKASVGDTVQIGRELLKVIDPRSMRFEGLVSADRLGELRVGQPVAFRVNGAAQADFTGKVRRIDASANATTRQVELIVAFDDPAQAPRVAGLFAEGRVEAGSTQGLMLPETVIVRVGDAAHAWRVSDGVVRKAVLKLGARDARTGHVLLTAGLAAGDRVLRNPGSGLADGQKFEMAKAPARAASAAPAPASR